MENFKIVDANEFVCAPAKLIGKDWMLITAEKDGKVNTMTAAWGGLGVIWRKPSSFIFVRESRFTKEFLDGSDKFSLCFFDPEKYRDTLNYLGKVSGRDEDKIAKSNLTVEHEDGVPYFKEANKVIICNKMSCHLIHDEGMLSDEVKETFYSTKDYHYMYVGGIEKILEK